MPYIIHDIMLFVNIFHTNFTFYSNMLPAWMLFPLRKSEVLILFAFSACISSICSIPCFALINSPCFGFVNNIVPASNSFSLYSYSFSSNVDITFPIKPFDLESRYIRLHYKIDDKPISEQLRDGDYD